MASFITPLHWRHNDHDGVSYHQPHGCLLKRLFRRRSKKTSKRHVTGLCVGNSPGPVNSPHKGPVMRKMFPFDDVIMHWAWLLVDSPEDSHPIRLNNTDHWWFFRLHPEQAVEQTVELPIKWDAMTLMWRQSNPIARHFTGPMCLL